MKTYIWIIASNHLSVWHLMTKAVRRLIRIDWHIQNVWWLHGQESVAQVWAKGPTQYTENEYILGKSMIWHLANLQLDWTDGLNLPVFDLFLSGRLFIGTFPSPSPGPSLLFQPPQFTLWWKTFKFKTTVVLDGDSLSATQLTFQCSSFCTFIAAHFQFLF